MKTKISNIVVATVPPELRRKKITANFLKTNEADEDFIDVFQDRFPNGANYFQVRQWLTQLVEARTTDIELLWENWLKETIGDDKAEAIGATIAVGSHGDQAIAGHSGIAITDGLGTSKVGDFGLAVTRAFGNSTAKDWGVAIAGNNGVAKAGHLGKAITEEEGSAITGEGGVAIADEGGTVSAGQNGVIAIFYYDLNGRKRLRVGYIGESGLEPNVEYRLDKKNMFIKA